MTEGARQSVCQACGTAHECLVFDNGDEMWSACPVIGEEFYTSEQGRANRGRQEKT